MLFREKEFRIWWSVQIGDKIEAAIWLALLYVNFVLVYKNIKHKEKGKKGREKKEEKKV